MLCMLCLPKTFTDTLSAHAMHAVLEKARFHMTHLSGRSGPQRLAVVLHLPRLAAFADGACHRLHRISRLLPLFFCLHHRSYINATLLTALQKLHQRYSFDCVTEAASTLVKAEQEL